MGFTSFNPSYGLIGVAGWGWQSVLMQMPKWDDPQGQEDTISRRIEVRYYIWSSQAPRALRRRFIATQACAIPAGLCLAALVWLNETRPDARFWGTAVFCALSCLMAGLLTYNVIQCRARKAD